MLNVFLRRILKMILMYLLTTLINKSNKYCQVPSEIDRKLGPCTTSLGCRFSDSFSRLREGSNLPLLPPHRPLQGPEPGAAVSCRRLLNPPRQSEWTAPGVGDILLIKSAPGAKPPPPPPVSAGAPPCQG